VRLATSRIAPTEHPISHCCYLCTIELGVITAQRIKLGIGLLKLSLAFHAGSPLARLAGPSYAPCPQTGAYGMGWRAWGKQRAVTTLAAASRQMLATITAKTRRAFRLTRIQFRRSKSLRLKRARRAYVAALMQLFRAQQVSARAGRSSLAHLNRWPATIFALLVCAFFLSLIQDVGNLKTSEVYLTCAQVIGAALALILSLSIIPAQRAAEAFSPAVLKLYAQDRSLVAAFVILAATTTLSVLLGTNFLSLLDARISICIQFVLLGASFDALRLFYTRVLNLLIPQTAVQIVIRECTRPLNKVSRTVEKLARLHALATGDNAHADALRALYFSASFISGSLRFWIAQLAEIAHKLIARRETSAANDIVAAMGKIGMQYSEARRNSLILRPDFDSLFVGGVSDISHVLDPIYDSIHVICEDAAKASNELVVKQGIQTVAEMTIHAMTMIHSSNGWHQAPLAFSAGFRLGQCSTIAVKANMGDAVLTVVKGFQTILLNQKPDVNTGDLEAQSLESLLNIAFASYAASDAVWVFPAVRAILLAARHDIEINGYRDKLETVLEYMRSLTPLEVAMEKAGRRTVQTFPAYAIGFNANIPHLLEMIAHQVKVDAERPWIDPFDDFLEAAEDIRHHYRELSKTDFQNTLLRKWVVDSMIAAARIHWTLLVQPPVGTEGHIDDVDESLRALISWVPEFFPEPSQPHKSHLTDAADALACLGISLLEHDRIESARRCASAIAGLATNSAAHHPEPYTLADLQKRLEVLARAADALGKAQPAASFRALIQKPDTVSDAEWPHYVKARETRLRQLDDRLGDRPHRYGTIRDDPVAELQRVLKQSAS
jgi:hypothetical protein